MAKLFSYVVQHDTGLAPNAEGRYCTLAVCKFGTPQHRNIVELTEIGDWILGTGGADPHLSTGHGTIIYLMRVDEKLTLRTYKRQPRFKHRADARFARHISRGRLALISHTFYYFGRDAVPIATIPLTTLGLAGDLEKRGPGFRSDFDEAFIRQLVTWTDEHWKRGRHGEPCAPHDATGSNVKDPADRRRKLGAACDLESATANLTTSPRFRLIWDPAKDDLRQFGSPSRLKSSRRAPLKPMAPPSFRSYCTSWLKAAWSVVLVELSVRST